MWDKTNYTGCITNVRGIHTSVIHAYVGKVAMLAGDTQMQEICITVHEQYRLYRLVTNKRYVHNEHNIHTRHTKLNTLVVQKYFVNCKGGNVE